MFLFDPLTKKYLFTNKKKEIKEYLFINLKKKIKEYLLTNKKKEIKYAHDKVAVFSMFTQYQYPHPLPCPNLLPCPNQ